MGQAMCMEDQYPIAVPGEQGAIRHLFEVVFLKFVIGW